MSSSEPVVEHTTAGWPWRRRGIFRNASPVRHALLHDLCAGGSRHSGSGVGVRCPDIRVGGHPRGGVRRCRTRSSWLSWHDVHPGGRAVRVDEDGWGRFAAGLGSVLYWVRTRSGSAARWHSSPPTHGARTSTRSARDSRSGTSPSRWFSSGSRSASRSRRCAGASGSPMSAHSYASACSGFSRSQSSSTRSSTACTGSVPATSCRTTCSSSWASCRCSSSTTSASSCRTGRPRRCRTRRRDVPVTVIQSGIVECWCTGSRSSGSWSSARPARSRASAASSTPSHTTFGVYGGAQNFMTDVMAIGFMFALVTSGSVWMMGSDRILAVAAYDGAFPGYFGPLPPRLGTPVRVNVMSGVVSTIFMFVRAAAPGSASAAATFTVDDRPCDIRRRCSRTS